MAYYRSTIMAKAWCLSRAGARRFGGTARQYLAAALRQSWAEAKASAARRASADARVLVELEKIRAEAAVRPAAASRPYVLPPRARRAFTLPARPRLVADSWEARQVARFRQEDDCPDLRRAA